MTVYEIDMHRPAIRREETGKFDQCKHSKEKGIDNITLLLQ